MCGMVVFEAQWPGMPCISEDSTFIYKTAPELLKKNIDNETLGSYLNKSNLSKYFTNYHIIPTVAASPTWDEIVIELLDIVWFRSWREIIKLELDVSII